MLIKNTINVSNLKEDSTIEFYPNKRLFYDTIEEVFQDTEFDKPYLSLRIFDKKLIHCYIKINVYDWLMDEKMVKEIHLMTLRKNEWEIHIKEFNNSFLQSVYTQIKNFFFKNSKNALKEKETTTTTNIETIPSFSALPNMEKSDVEDMEVEEGDSSLSELDKIESSMSSLPELGQDDKDKESLRRETFLKNIGIRDEYDPDTRPTSDVLLNKQNYDVYTRDYVNSVLNTVKPNEREVVRLERIFKKLLDMGHSDFSERLDIRKMYRKIKTFKDPYNAYKKEYSKPIVLFLMDVSGSMAPIIKPILPLIHEVTKKLDYSCCVINTNSFPHFVFKDKKKRELPHIDEFEKANEVYEELFEKYDIRYVVNFADFDGARTWNWLLENTTCKWLWLHYYGAREYKNIPQKPTHPKEFFPEEFHHHLHRITFYHAVNECEEAIKIMEKI